MKDQETREFEVEQDWSLNQHTGISSLARHGSLKMLMVFIISLLDLYMVTQLGNSIGQECSLTQTMIAGD
jgi:hypothetical protein